MNPIRQFKEKPFYKWVIIVASFMMILCCIGFCSSNKGLFLAAITEALGIKRSLFSLNDSFRYITTALVNLLFGVLIGRFGPRKLIAAGFGCITSALLIYSVAESIWFFYLGGILLGIGLSWTGTTMVGFVVNRWCAEKKGTIMGMVLASSGIGNALAVQFTTPTIYSGMWGYRSAYRLMALLILIAGVVIVTLFKDAPARVTSTTTAKKKTAAWEGLTFAQCLRKPYFYVSCVTIFFTGLVLQSVSGVAGAHMKDLGMDPDYVATVMSVYALCLAGFKFLSGFCHDKFGLRTTLIICYVAAIIMSVLLACLSNTPQGKVMAMAYAVIVGASLPLETVMLPLIAADLFGQKDYAKIMGIFVAINTTGYAVGGPVTNLFFDMLGTYRHIFLIFGGMMVVLVIVFQFVLNAAHRCSAQSAGSAGGN